MRKRGREGERGRERKRGREFLRSITGVQHPWDDL
jgi:hypothetical protein